MPRSWTPAALHLGLAAAVALAVGVSAQEFPARPLPRPVAVVGFAQLAGQPQPAAGGLSDEDALKQAGLSAADTPRLIAYLRQRTLSDADQTKIQDVIRRFGADAFDARQQASEDVEAFGPAAIGPLKAAARDPNPEVAARAADALARLEKVPHSAVAAAAVRVLLKSRPPEATGVLLGFLPLADTETVADQIRDAVASLAVRDGKADPAVVAALADTAASRRAAAAAALAGVKDPAVLAQVTAAVRKEADPEAKFRGVWALVVRGRDKGFVPELVKLIPQASRGRLWQAEDLLLQLAGGAAPDGGRFGKSPEAVGKAADAWLAWWGEKGGGIDLARLDLAGRVRGVIDLVEMDTSFGTGSRVRSLGPDGKERWQMTGLGMVWDARVLPSGAVLTAEYNSNRVVERDPFSQPPGKELNTRQVPNLPVAAEPLPGGGTLIALRTEVAEYDRNGARVWGVQRPNGDILTARRAANGETLVLTTKQNNPNNLIRLDAKGGEVGKLPVGPSQAYGSLDPLPGGRVLVGETTRVAEYDLKTGKDVWRYDVPNPTCAQRLSNGNTLITTSMNPRRVMEVDPAGEVVWEYRPADNFSIIRAYRR